ncbi:MAG: hypothetical protein AAF719_12015 [Pseudomonadota bacterium]
MTDQPFSQERLTTCRRVADQFQLAASSYQALSNDLEQVKRELEGVKNDRDAAYAAAAINALTSAAGALTLVIRSARSAALFLRAIRNKDPDTLKESLLSLVAFGIAIEKLLSIPDKNKKIDKLIEEIRELEESARLAEENYKSTLRTYKERGCAAVLRVS